MLLKLLNKEEVGANGRLLPILRNAPKTQEKPYYGGRDFPNFYTNDTNEHDTMKSLTFYQGIVGKREQGTVVQVFPWSLINHQSTS
ncbi:hypothetical protein [Okeania sp.]|uniref:hypothetical protein n=1 Tax=Okeania sp. TaxID=3100323 RepID=UPI002B4B44E6|nr:hypothetical protein [Okeania sp.]MEB3342889.1 hypothetical protein [Okeania sp.]